MASSLTRLRDFGGISYPPPVEFALQGLRLKVLNRERATRLLELLRTLRGGDANGLHPCCDSSCGSRSGVLKGDALVSRHAELAHRYEEKDMGLASARHLGNAGPLDISANKNFDDESTCVDMKPLANNTQEHLWLISTRQQQLKDTASALDRVRLGWCKERWSYSPACCREE